MKPQKQTILGTDGNCLSACIATLFAVDIAEVPHFVMPDDGRWWDRLQSWCRARGVEALSFDMTEVEGGPLAHHWWTTAGNVIAGGTSPRGYPHACVYADGKLVWDPHPDGTGLAAIENVKIFVLREPWRLRADAHTEGLREAAAKCRSMASSGGPGNSWFLDAAEAIGWLVFDREQKLAAAARPANQARPETHEWVGQKCGIVTPYECVGDGEEYREGDEDDCCECDAPVSDACLAIVRRKVGT